MSPAGRDQNGPNFESLDLFCFFEFFDGTWILNVFSVFFLDISCQNGRQDKKLMCSWKCQKVVFNVVFWSNLLTFKSRFAKSDGAVGRVRTSGGRGSRDDWDCGGAVGRGMSVGRVDFGMDVASGRGRGVVAWVRVVSAAERRRSLSPSPALSLPSSSLAFLLLTPSSFITSFISVCSALLALLVSPLLRLFCCFVLRLLRCQ